MRKIFLLFSHKLTAPQRREIDIDLHCRESCYLPEELQKEFSQITERNIELVEKQVKNYLISNGKNGDYVLIQGEWGITYRIVNFAKKMGMVPIYSSTRRESSEIMNGDKVEKISSFCHNRFLKY